VISEVTSSRKAVCRLLARFLDGGWSEIVESLDDEEGDRLFDEIESAHAKLSRMARAEAA